MGPVWEQKERNFMIMRFRKYAAICGLVLGLTALLAAPAKANHIDTTSVTLNCTSVCLTVTGSELTDTGVSFVVNYEIIITPAGSSTPVQDITGTLTLTPDSNGDASTTVCNNFAALASGNYNVTGSATLTQVDSGGNVVETDNTLPISGSASLSCGGPPPPPPPPPPGKTFSIGPSSMEGSLFIHPGDFVNGGYNFKFTSGSHPATMYTVTATVTVPVTCSDNSIQNIVVPLGAPGQLDGGGVTTFTFNIAAGDTTNHASGDQNSILVWEGAVQAPAGLCGGAGGRNQRGAVFSATVSQNPPAGLVDWQFHYRDPAAKGKPNTDCTNANDPNRNRADVCGASWSQTVRDP